MHFHYTSCGSLLLAVLAAGCGGAKSAGLETPEAGHVSFESQRITDDDLARMEWPTEVTSISLAGCPITDQGVPQLKRASGLTHLNLNGTQITDNVLEHIRQMPQLAQVYVDASSVTPQAKRELTALLSQRAAKAAAERRARPPVTPAQHPDSFGRPGERER